MAAASSPYTHTHTDVAAFHARLILAARRVLGATLPDEARSDAECHSMIDDVNLLIADIRHAEQEEETNRAKTLAAGWL